MKPLLAVILLLLGPRTETVDPARLAAAITAESQNAPRSPYEWQRLMLAIAENETRLSARIAEGRCKPAECDHGRARGLWQVHRNTLNRDSWAKQDGDIELQAHLASEQLKRAYWTCAKSGQPWLVGTINAYAGRRCSDTSWAELQARVATSRDWVDRHAIFSCLSNHPDRSILLHGGCRGGDSIAAAVGKQLAFKVWELPFFLGEDGREARNESLVAVACALRDKGHRVTCYAWPMEGSVGTRKCMRLMRQAGLRIANWGDE